MINDISTQHPTAPGVDRLAPRLFSRPRPSAGRLLAALPVLALVAVAVTWGVTFSVLDRAADAVPAADLVAWRFGVATLALGMVKRFMTRRATRTTPPMPSALRQRAVLLGGILGLGFLLQTWAITDTDAVMSGFLIGTLVVIAPVIGWVVFRVRPTRVTWCGGAVAIAGLATLSLQGAGFGRGEATTLLAAALWALHLVLLARWGRPEYALEFARIQTATVSAMALATVAVGGLLSGGPILPTIPSATETRLSVAFLALPATAGAMLALSWAQPRMSAARAAIILTLEPAAGAVTASLLGADFDGRTIVGGTLLVVAMLIVEVGDRLRPARDDHPDVAMAI